jgi:chromosome segregation ATPase
MTEQHRRSRFEPCGNCAPAEVRALTPEREAEWRKDAETACQWITKHYRDTDSDNAPARILVLLDALRDERTARQQAERRRQYAEVREGRLRNDLADMTRQRDVALTECEAWRTDWAARVGELQLVEVLLVDLLARAEKAEQELADLRTRLVLMVTEANETHASSQAFSALRGELRDLADPTKEGRSDG